MLGTVEKSVESLNADQGVKFDSSLSPILFSMVILLLLIQERLLSVKSKSICWVLVNRLVEAVVRLTDPLDMTIG